MKYSSFCGVLLLLLTSAACDAGKDKPAQGGGATAASRAEPIAEVGGPGSEVHSADEIPQTPGGAIYGEVVAATDEIIAALDRAVSDPAALAALNGAVDRFDVAARNWKAYLARTDGAELTLLQQSQLAKHAETSGQKLRESILRTARTPEAESLSDTLRRLLRVVREWLSATERADFERWLRENKLW